MTSWPRVVSFGILVAGTIGLMLAGLWPVYALLVVTLLFAMAAIA